MAASPIIPLQERAMLFTQRQLLLSRNAGAAISQVIAPHFQTVAATNDYWRE